VIIEQVERLHGRIWNGEAKDAPISCSRSAAPSSMASLAPVSVSCSRPKPIPRPTWPWPPDPQSVDALDGERAQQLRRAAFEERLSSGSLRAYLKKLPDFEDVEAEDRAMRHALGFRNFSAALYFFHEWPDPAHAAQLVLERASEIDGNAYYLLDPVARQIEGRHPLAATLLRRAMIDDTLQGAKSSRYKHAARHLLECQSLATMIRDYGTFETDEAFTSRLRASHARKSGFWKQVAEVSGTQP
jgi:hypothetical protein